MEVIKIMSYIYQVILKPILTNQIIVDWIAPIVTGLILLLIPVILTKFIKNNTLLKNIKDVNNKIINTIRPFIIQRIEINSHFISDLRKAIIKENKIKEKYIFNEIQIRNKILLDISETRFLKENEKQDLINFTYKVFNDFDEKQILSNTSSEDIEEQNIKKLSMKLTSIILIISLIIMLIAYIVKPVNSNIEDNIVILITLISSTASLLSLFTNYLDLNSFHDKALLNVTKEMNNTLLSSIKNISHKKDNKKKF